MGHPLKVPALKTLEHFTAFKGRSLKFKTVVLIMLLLNAFIMTRGIYERLFALPPGPDVVFTSSIIAPR